MLTASFQAYANRKPLVHNQHGLHMQTQRRGWSSSTYTHPLPGLSFQDFVKIMHLKMFSKLEYAGIGQDKMRYC